MAGQKQMLECTRCKMKSVNSSIGDYENRTMTYDNGQRVVWSREKYEYYNAQLKKSAVHDWSRRHLNFEINTKTGMVQDVDHNKPSLRERWQAVMDQHYTAVQEYTNPKTGKKVTKKRPVRSNEIKLVGTLMGGNRKRMHELAFDRKVVTGEAGTAMCSGILKLRPGLWIVTSGHARHGVGKILSLLSCIWMKRIRIYIVIMCR